MHTGFSRRFRSAIAVIFSVFFLAGMYSCACYAQQYTQTETGEEQLFRCIGFYSKINGVNSTIYQVLQEMESQWMEEGKAALSTYSLSSELYDSFLFKARTALELDMDLLIVANMPDKLSSEDIQVLDRLREKKTVILIVDGEPADYPYSLCISTDNESSGKLVAEYLLGEKAGETYGPARTVGIVATSFRSGSISSSRVLREKGFRQAARSYDGWKLYPRCVCLSDTTQAMEKLRGYLDERPDIDTLYCLDSASGVTAAKVLEEEGKKDQVEIICYDQTSQVSRMMQEGLIDEVVVQDIPKIASACISTVLSIADHGFRDQLQDKSCLIDSYLITADNVKITADKNSSEETDVDP